MTAFTLTALFASGMPMTMWKSYLVIKQISSSFKKQKPRSFNPVWVMFLPSVLFLDSCNHQSSDATDWCNWSLARDIFSTTLILHFVIYGDINFWFHVHFIHNFMKLHNQLLNYSQASWKTLMTSQSLVSWQQCCNRTIVLYTYLFIRFLYLNSYRYFYIRRIYNLKK